jgi:hypothetical protein
MVGVVLIGDLLGWGKLGLSCGFYEIKREIDFRLGRYSQREPN